MTILIEHLLELFHIYRNLRDIELGLRCKLHNDTQPVMSHCIMTFETTVARTRNLIEKLGKVTINVLCDKNF